MSSNAGEAQFWDTIMRVQGPLILLNLLSPREKLIKIGAKVVSHGRYVTFQLAEVAVPRRLFADILSLITRPRVPPMPV